MSAADFVWTFANRVRGRAKHPMVGFSGCLCVLRPSESAASA
ncbi:hypothetical protein HMPREF9123_0970 [Neisseria bacilliformis ATCC BAA-1200]|uniref:Uncharacterized protein n=1 Tax=Neisseria bacilliformis ATCC BAA-1200 TaxID=888742 RepID=F2BB66_9NEIS|nr:hypothetical protein HMPREF9123_0970 [Neisseria bacilliformis ATCC BAA-1200]